MLSLDPALGPSPSDRNARPVVKVRNDILCGLWTRSEMTKSRIFWKKWGQFIATQLTLLGSVASIAALLFYFLPKDQALPAGAWVALAVATGVLIFFLISDFRNTRSRKIYSREDSEGIRKYMHLWIKHGGRIAIWTRDMSWAWNRETHRLLLEKAGKNELIICLPEMNDRAAALAAAGAEICCYGSSYLDSPASRFTIAFFGRDGSRVAVGRAEGELHVIEEFSGKDHPAFYIAEDLITLVRSMRRRGVDQGHQTESS